MGILLVYNPDGPIWLLQLVILYNYIYPRQSRDAKRALGNEKIS